MPSLMVPLPPPPESRLVPAFMVEARAVALAMKLLLRDGDDCLSPCPIARTCGVGNGLGGKGDALGGGKGDTLGGGKGDTLGGGKGNALGGTLGGGGDIWIGGSCVVGCAGPGGSVISVGSSSCGATMCIRIGIAGGCAST